MKYDPNNIELDASRYRRLRILGCALTDEQMEAGNVVRATNLDAMVDIDIRNHPSRGEVKPRNA